MARGPLFQADYRPQFSGHETFPLRYGWLKKTFDRVAETEIDGKNRPACWDNDAIARFGVGKNMVASMRHWAKATDIIDETGDAQSVKTTTLGRFVFSADGLDPYMEHPATLWLIHWQLASRPEKTTWFWTFNHFPALSFERDALITRLHRLAKGCQWTKASPTTIKNDVACFIRMYVARQPSGKTGHDDASESPLTELGIIKPVGKKDGFRFVRGPKATLGDGVVLFSIIDFWERYSPTSGTLSFEALAHAPGSPGRVFALDENDVADRLAALDDITAGAIRWSETAGLKQLVRSTEFSDDLRYTWLSLDYTGSVDREVA